MQALKQHRSITKALPDLLNWASLIDDGIVLNKDGSLTAGYYYRGADPTSATNAEMNCASANLNQALSKLDNQWMLHQDAIRIESNYYPEPDDNYFPDPITGLIESERREQFRAEGSHYESLYVLILTYLPESQSKSKFQEMMFTDDSTPVNSPTYAGDQALERFKSTLDDVEDQLSGVLSMQRMCSVKAFDPSGREVIQDQLLQYLHYALTGDSHPITVPPCPMYLDSVIGGHEFYSGVTPKIDNNYIQVVAIDGFPQESYPGILMALDQSPTKYRWSTRFIFQDAVEAKSAIKKYKRKWQQKVRGFVDQLINSDPTAKSAIDQDALAMVAETETALAEASSGLVTYGYYTSVIILMDPDEKALKASTRQLKALINKQGFVARVETVNAVEAFLGSLPGHGVQNVRRPLLHTMHLADLLPVSSIWAGEETAPCTYYKKGSPPLLYGSTTGSTPFRFNLHVGDLGHTLVFGPSGAGKSTLLTLIAAQFRRYENATIFAFDKGLSMSTLTRAVGGSFYDICGSEEHSSLRFAPLQHLKTDFSWVFEWVCTLIELQGVPLNPNLRIVLKDALTSLRDSVNPYTLSNLCIEVQDHDLKSALDYYCSHGPIGDFLDADPESLEHNDLSSFNCFEIETLMELDDKYRLPVLLYLFFMVEDRLKGQPGLLILDEAWLMLSHPVFRGKIETWLKVLRKTNCAVILATQSISDATKSGILDVLIEGCATKIYLSNTNAMGEESTKLYQSMGCNQGEIATIASLTPKREYFMKGQGSRRFSLNMGPIALSFCGVAGQENAQLVEQIMNASDAKEWPYRWLDKRNVNYEHLQET